MASNGIGERMLKGVKCEDTISIMAQWQASVTLLMQLQRTAVGSIASSEIIQYKISLSRTRCGGFRAPSRDKCCFAQNCRCDRTTESLLFTMHGENQDRIELHIQVPHLASLMVSVLFGFAEHGGQDPGHSLVHRQLGAELCRPIPKLQILTSSFASSPRPCTHSKPFPSAGIVSCHPDAFSAQSNLRSACFFSSSASVDRGGSGWLRGLPLPCA